MMLKVLVGFILLLLTSEGFAQTIYLRPDQALKIIFQNSKEIVSEKKILTPEQQRNLEKRLGTKLAKTEWNFYVAKTDGRVEGYAVIDSEIGKTEPITFLTAITPEGKVKEIEILVYREPIGSEVREKRFLGQYRGKKGSDPVRTGQDIGNISGATLSARAVSNGVKRDLLLWELFYGKR